MAVLIYHEQAGDKLKLLAEVGEDNVELAVDALLDAEPKFAQHQPFIVFPAEQRMVVEVGEIVRPRRDIKINGGSGNGAVAEPKTRKPRATRTRQTQPQVEQGEVETDPDPATEAPAEPVVARKRAAKAKPAAKRGPGRPKGSTNKKSPFKRNPAGDE